MWCVDSAGTPSHPLNCEAKMPILLGAIAYKNDLPGYDEFLDEWLDKSLKPAPSIVKCPMCDVDYKLIEPDVEPEGTVNSDIATLRNLLANKHPDHPLCVPFRA